MRKPRWRHMNKIRIFDGIALLSYHLSRCLQVDGIGLRLAVYLGLAWEQLRPSKHPSLRAK